MHDFITKKNSVTQSHAVLFSYVSGVFGTMSEKKRDAPQTCETDQRIDDAAETGSLTAKEPCNQIKFCKANQAPVDCADDDENKRYNVHSDSPFDFRQRIVCTYFSALTGKKGIRRIFLEKQVAFA